MWRGERGWRGTDSVTKTKGFNHDWIYIYRVLVIFWVLIVWDVGKFVYHFEMFWMKERRMGKSGDQCSLSLILSRGKQHRVPLNILSKDQTIFRPIVHHCKFPLGTLNRHSLDPESL